MLARPPPVPVTFLVGVCEVKPGGEAETARPCRGLRSVGDQAIIEAGLDAVLAHELGDFRVDTLRMVHRPTGVCRRRKP